MRCRPTSATTPAHRIWQVRLTCLGLALILLAGGCAGPGAANRTAAGPVLCTLLEAGSPRAELLSRLGLPSATAPDALQAMSSDRYRVVVVDATPKAVGSLAEHASMLQDFTKRGGWLMLWGLTPAGLADFNRLVGVQHLMRPFTVEAVRLPTRTDALLSGCTPFDVLMLGGRGVQGIPLRAGDVWSFVLDGDDIAPFASIPDAGHWRPGSSPAPGTDQYPPNLVNGMDDSWQLGFTIPTDGPQDLDWTFAFPRPETVTRFSLTPDLIYRRITRIRLSFPGSSAAAVETPIDPEAFVRQDVAIPSVRCSGVRLEILAMTASAAPVTGIRNVEIQVARSAEFRSKVRPLLSLGVLNAYPMGHGGIVVNQMNLPDGLSMENRDKQQRILATLLGHLLRDPEAAAEPPRSGPLPIPGSDAVTVDSFLDPEDVDETQAIRKALWYALHHQKTKVLFAAGTYCTSTPIQIAGCDGIVLSGAVDAQGRPATKLLFDMPTRYLGGANVPTMITNAGSQNLLLRY